MKSSFSRYPLLCAAALATGILGDIRLSAQPAVEAWVQRYNGLAESDDRAKRTVVDTSGALIVVGSSDVGVNGSDWLILKYSSAGVPLRTNLYTGADNSVDSANAVTVDDSGNVIVTGYSYGSDFDCVTIKYSSAGVPLWTNRYSRPANGFDFANGLAVDGSGNVFVTVASWNGGTYDYVTIKYSSTGAPLLAIARTTTNTVVVSWPSPAAAFTLQQNTNG